MRPAVAAAALLLSAGGCFEADEGDDVIEDPLRCDQAVSLDGSAADRVTIQANVDQDGFGLCLHLDGTANYMAHLAAGTGWSDGTTSPFQLALIDSAARPIRAGWDVTVGETDPRTFANLEWSMAGGEVRDVILRLTTRDGDGIATTLDASLFEPFE